LFKTFKLFKSFKTFKAPKKGLAIGEAVGNVNGAAMEDAFNGRRSNLPVFQQANLSTRGKRTA
jgi:hypothetical protein